MLFQLQSLHQQHRSWSCWVVLAGLIFQIVAFVIISWFLNSKELIRFWLHLDPLLPAGVIVAISFGFLSVFVDKSAQNEVAGVTIANIIFNAFCQFIFVGTFRILLGNFGWNKRSITWYKVYRFMAIMFVVVLQNLVTSNELTGSEIAFFGSIFGLMSLLMLQAELVAAETKDELEGVDEWYLGNGKGCIVSEALCFPFAFKYPPPKP